MVGVFNGEPISPTGGAVRTAGAQLDVLKFLILAAVNGWQLRNERQKPQIVKDLPRFYINGAEEDPHARVVDEVQIPLST